MLRILDYPSGRVLLVVRLPAGVEDKCRPQELLWSRFGRAGRSVAARYGDTWAA